MGEFQPVREVKEIMPIEVAELTGQDVVLRAGPPPVVDWREEAIRSGCDEVRLLMRTGYHNQSELGRAESALSLLKPTLRSKPDNPRRLAEALLSGARNPGSAGVVIVLASPTAEKEVPYFLDCAGRLRQSLGGVRMDVILVRWENLIEDLQVRESERSAYFNSLAGRIRDQMSREGWDADNLHVVDITVTSDGEALISSPEDFALADEEVRRAASQFGNSNTPKQLAQDLKWSVDYYSRQSSLGRLGRRQALFDLALRREIGRAISAGRLWSGPRLAPTRICLTSELIPRMVRCYRLEVANLNISVTH